MGTVAIGFEQDGSATLVTDVIEFQTVVGTIRANEYSTSYDDFYDVALCNTPNGKRVYSVSEMIVYRNA